jgi:3-oxoacyl-[acyl-carrier-protein] synthase II
MTGAVISAWSAVSPFGVGRARFTAGLQAGQPTASTPDAAVWSVPDAQACLVPDFVISQELGKKGTRAMDRATGLAVTAVGRLLEESSMATGEGAALVLGTTTGSVQSMMDFTRGGLVSEKPYFVDPARFPNAVMNCAAGQCAIWHQLKGPNTTIAGGRVAGLHALKYAQGLLNAGRAVTTLCGAVEEYSNARSWLDWHTRGADEAGAVLGEGCAMLQLESSGDGLAEILAVELGVFAQQDATAALTACVRRALAKAGVDSSDVWAVCPSGAVGTLGTQEQAVVMDIFTGTEVVRIADLIGDTSGAAAIFQVVTLLAMAAPGQVAVVTSVDRDGETGAAVLRLK